MSDLQPRRLPPSPGDASHAQFMRWRANEQNDEVSSADGSRASGSSVDEQSNEEFSTDESSDDGWRTFGLSADEQSDVEFSADELSDDGYSFTLQGWTFKRWRNALPLAISARIPLEVFEIIINAMNPPH
ncbi:uncharacterized protein B0H18DRAFT_1116243 [Fomitopsis serialis]|uniref:uncharacterized protein n=1 Tax=Fomitopsis serialis TaxID=139415 RepID=UPI0020077E12|nr:uncharacterized protein B0H18DRAFT_1116243 [Neoantrodia serialis]KAH9931429.1 hypothetical protein B0H18DRAFT_1116243 [Neoantrodia serialis]